MDFLFKKTNSRYLAIIRIVLGSWFFIDLVSMLVSGYVTEAYVTSTVHFPFYGFEWIQPLPGIWMYVLYIFLAIIAIGITLGYRMRLCLMIFIIGFTYVFMCDIVYTLNKFYLFLWFAFILLFTGADKALSFAKEESKSKWVPYWQIFIFQFLFALIYTYSGISKLNPDWLFHAEPLMIFLKYKIPFKWMSDEVYQYAAFTFTYCGMIFDLTISGLLVYNNRTRVIGHILQITFHSLNFVLLGIGSLSIFAAILTMLLFPLPWVRRKLKLETTVTNEVMDLSPKRMKWITSGLVALMIFHIMLPHRHYITDNNVNWTEKGHRFSWRLMTRTKRGSTSLFFVSSDQTEKPIRIKPKEILTRRQYRKMSAETDLVITFAHYLRDKYKKEGHTNIKVTSNIMTKLNGRNKRHLIDPKLDLAKVSRSVFKDNVSTPLELRSN